MCSFEVHGNPSKSFVYMLEARYYMEMNIGGGDDWRGVGPIRLECGMGLLARMTHVAEIIHRAFKRG